MKRSPRRRPYCPCGGVCHRSASPCSMACLDHAPPDRQLTACEQVEVIEAYDAGFSAANIALQLGVSRSAVLAVLRSYRQEAE